MSTGIGRIAAFEDPSTEDAAAIRQVIADYYGAWFDADADRMAGVLHPQLAKRGWVTVDGERIVDGDTRETMVEWTRRGMGRTDDPDGRAIDIRIVEAYGDVATALVHTLKYIESLQLIRTAAGWQILNALWRAS